MSTHDDDRGEYKVGHCRPPKHTQYKKGRSGNPKGRPKGAKGFNASLKRELESQITVTEGQRRTTISKLEAAAKRFVAKALGGDVKVLLKLLELDMMLFGDAADAEGRSRSDKAETVDLELLRHFFTTEPASAISKDRMDQEDDDVVD